MLQTPHLVESSLTLHCAAWCDAHIDRSMVSNDNELNTTLVAYFWDHSAANYMHSALATSCNASYFWFYSWWGDCYRDLRQVATKSQVGLCSRTLWTHCVFIARFDIGQSALLALRITGTLAPSLSTFRQRLKTHIFRRSFPHLVLWIHIECHFDNC